MHTKPQGAGRGDIYFGFGRYVNPCMPLGVPCHVVYAIQFIYPEIHLIRLMTAGVPCQRIVIQLISHCLPEIIDVFPCLSADLDTDTHIYSVNPPLLILNRDLGIYANSQCVCVLTKTSHQILAVD